MANQERWMSWRALSAILVAAGLIGSAYFLARETRSPKIAQASVETELLEKIAARDTDTDGLRDWEEALYGTDPRMVDTRNLGMTDGEAVSKGLIVPAAPAPIGATTTTYSTFDPAVPIPAQGTITRALAESLITAYAAAVKQSPDGGLTPAEMQRITAELLDQFNKSVVPAPDFKTANDLRVRGSSAEDMRAFAVEVDAVLRANTSESARKSELTYLKALLEQEDETVYEHLLALSVLYEKAAMGLAVLPVPQNLVGTHLKLINSFSRLSKIIEDFTRTESDPIAAMLALKQYPEAVTQMGTAFVEVSSAYKSARITFAPTDPGAGFVNLVDRVIERQKSSPLPSP